MKTVTMADVAKKANVSKSTVSQFVNARYEFMSQETKERLEAIIQELNYKPNYVAKSLKQKKTSTIGVVVANILHTFSTQVIRAIEDHCNTENIHVIVCNADDNPQKERNYIEMLRAKQVDGLILFPTGGNLDLYQMMEKELYPLIFVDRMVEETTVSTILLDNQAASEMLVDHLVENGYKKIAFVTTSLEGKLTPRIERLEGYLKGLRRHSLPINEQHYSGVKKDAMNEEFARMFDGKQSPDSIICGNDLTLLEALKFFKQRGMDIPTDVALVSIDEVPYSEIFEPSLTIASQPAFQMGKEAADLLIEKINKGEGQQNRIVRYPPRLIMRESSLKRRESR
ncbi:LacI family transcriptional regulator [Sporosarcina newyorkensis 2681]|uniref:LacI family transcriptional regulator n=1 Tax=Sporosarcina newyorkensis 2681 TaxID=1027292 RepID=F9DRS5_9BACL|nr:substrate-binding domain-containing protein [Sporosarcina newyorkensis]EGQ26478.1 LacI family transcriptional regulator [Sporosarcina newyorkensis 2681]